MGGRSWPAAPLKKLRVTKITGVASVKAKKKTIYAAYLQKKKAKRQLKPQT